MPRKAEEAPSKTQMEVWQSAAQGATNAVADGVKSWRCTRRHGQFIHVDVRGARGTRGLHGLRRLWLYATASRLLLEAG